MKAQAGFYDAVRSSLEGVLEGGIPWESGLVSLIALLKEHHARISWVGFYRAQGADLWIGPYQGKLACLEIPAGKGVCGASFAQKKTLVVPDVDAFPGHIACDSLSRSEIVLPVFRAGQCVGVLDLDSHELSAFDETDAQNLESLLKMLDQRCR